MEFSFSNFSSTASRSNLGSSGLVMTDGYGVSLRHGGIKQHTNLHLLSRTTAYAAMPAWPSRLMFPDDAAHPLLVYGLLLSVTCVCA